MIIKVNSRERRAEAYSQIRAKKIELKFYLISSLLFIPMLVLLALTFEVYLPFGFALFFWILYGIFLQQEISDWSTIYKLNNI